MLVACPRTIVALLARFERLNGQDQTAFIISVNLARRNLTKGQQAMALAFIHPEPDKPGRGKKGKLPKRKELARRD
jgi:hypothetical protein